MSKIISHRGNIAKPIPERENKPSYIDAAIQLDYDVEVDLRLIDNKLWLGHDSPEVQVNENWLLERSSNLWVHCKNTQAANYLSLFPNKFQYFCHTKDPFVLTSTGKLWIDQLDQHMGYNAIIPLMSKNDIENYNHPPVSGYCTDHVQYAKLILQQRGLL